MATIPTMAPMSAQLQNALTGITNTFAPGGVAEQASNAQIDQQGKIMASKLGGAAISKGLGNTTNGIEAAVTNAMNQAKTSAKSDLLGHYVGGLQFLANLINQREMQQSTASNQLGNEMSLASFNSNLRRKDMKAANDLAVQNSAGGGSNGALSPVQYPNLLSAGGYGANGGSNYDFNSPLDIAGLMSTTASNGTPAGMSSTSPAASEMLNGDVYNEEQNGAFDNLVSLMDTPIGGSSNNATEDQAYENLLNLMNTDIE